MLIALFVTASCTDAVVSLPDLTDRVEQNETDITAAEARLALVEAKDALQDLRLDALEAAMALAEGRLDDAEAAIDASEADILTLFGLLDGLTGDLDALRSDLEDEVAKLQRADKKTRKMLRKKVAELRRKLCREIRERRLADAGLQRQIDNLERDLKRFEAKQKMVNKMFTFSLFMVNMRISQLENEIDREIRHINRQLDQMSHRISHLSREISHLSFRIRMIRRDLEDLETDDSVTVVYLCDGEVGLQTEEGMVTVAYEVESEQSCFEAGADIPTYFVCDQFHNGWGSSRMCKYGHNVYGGSAEVDVCINYDVIVDVFLTISEEEVCYVD